MSGLTAMELEQESIETLPARELMSGCGCSCGGNAYRPGW